MPKLIDYPRTNYTGAWELAEVTDDTGGKCAIETAAKKLNRKVSGSFKAIIGSAVKFGLVTSKRELISTTTLFKRIKHAYDREEELIFHREAFLTPPLFTQICRKFRLRELPIQMLDIILVREFGVEEINAQTVAKAFIEGCRMVKLIDEKNIINDIDSLASQRKPRNELLNPTTIIDTFQPDNEILLSSVSVSELSDYSKTKKIIEQGEYKRDISLTPDKLPATSNQPLANINKKYSLPDAVSNLFGLIEPLLPTPKGETPIPSEPIIEPKLILETTNTTVIQPTTFANISLASSSTETTFYYEIKINGPGVNTTLSITEREDITLAIAILEKIRRQLRL